MKKFTRKTSNNTSYLLTAGLTCSIFLFAPSVMADSLAKAIVSGKAKVDFRLRAEMVDQEGVDNKATSITARTRIGYETGKYDGLSAYGEFENTTAAVNDYAPIKPKANYPIVADPEGSEVNQAFIAYNAKKAVVKIGRQRVILDNSRFVGNVGWRQNEQTFDAALLQTTIIPDLTISYAYVTKVNTILGTSAETDTQLVNLKYTGLPVKLTAYSYMINNDGTGDSMTLGGSASGKIPFGKNIKGLYSAEFAQSGDYADNSTGNTANYYAVELGASFKKTTLKLGYEVLGGDGTTSFQTPLATKHKFNGWADKFLETPANGLVDAYASASGKVAGIKLLTAVHLYSSDNGSEDYGKELNALAIKKFGKHYSAGIKLAIYKAKDIKEDTNKLWVWGGISF